MYPFIETVRIVDGKVQNMDYHQARLEHTLSHFWPKCPFWSLEEVLQDKPMAMGVYKARVVYNSNEDIDVEYLPYTMRSIHSLKLVFCDDIDYTYKSADRSALNSLREQRGDADEIIIVKQGLLTDTSYSNIALFDGSAWFTPRTPLLKGTMRQSLLDQCLLKEIDIRVEDLKKFEKIALINAMMPLGVCEVQMENLSI